MSETYTRLVGHFQGRPYFITVSVSPSFNDIEEFAVSLHYNNPRREDDVQVARIDTAHGGVHFDRLYRRDQPKDETVEFSVWEAEARIEAQWRRYADHYAENHQ